MEPIDSSRCERLALRATAGDGAAWTELLAQLWPAWLRLIKGSRAMGPLGASEDHVRNVATNLAQKLGGEGARGLGLYAPWREQHQEKTFGDWIRIVTANAVRDYVRQQMGDATIAIQGEPSQKRLINELRTSPLVDRLGIRPAMTAAQTARKLVEFARVHLPKEQLDALTLWIQGAAYDEVADQLSFSEPETARRLVRAAVATLRREFADPDHG